MRLALKCVEAKNGYFAHTLQAYATVLSSYGGLVNRQSALSAQLQLFPQMMFQLHFRHCRQYFRLSGSPTPLYHLGAICAGMNVLRQLVSPRFDSVLALLSMSTFILGYGIMSDEVAPYFESQWRSLAKIQFGSTACMTLIGLCLTSNKLLKRGDFKARC